MMDIGFCAVTLGEAHFVLKEQSLNANEVTELVRRAGQGDTQAWETLFAGHQGRLLRVVSLRLDPRLRRRVDPADVIQETYLEAFQRLEEYRRRPEMPFFVWLRLLAVQKLIQTHRRHLGAQARNAARDISLNSGASPAASSTWLAEQLLGHGTTASQATIRAELQLHLQSALESLDPIDREIIALRHFEQLSNKEAAEVLGIKRSAASNRYMRGIARLKRLLDGRPEFRDFWGLAGASERAGD